MGKSTARDIKIGRYETDFQTPNSNDATHVRIDVSFNGGGLNYFSGGYEKKGYQVTFNPVAIDGGWESCIVGDRRGIRVFVVAAPRFDARRLAAVADLIEPHAEVLALLVALANGDGERLRALGELVRRIVAGSVTDADKALMQMAHAQADPHCTCNDCIPTDAARVIANEVVGWTLKTPAFEPLAGPRTDYVCTTPACVEHGEKACIAGVSPMALTRAEAEDIADVGRAALTCEYCGALIAGTPEPEAAPDREAGDDDGREYADPRDEMDRRLLID